MNSQNKLISSPVLCIIYPVYTNCYSFAYKNTNWLIHFKQLLHTKFSVKEHGSELMDTLCM